MKKIKLADDPLKIICAVGLVLTLIISWGMVLSALIWGGGKGKVPESTFARSLKEYDLFDAPKRAMEGENPQQIERLLSRLQRQVSSVEEQLSVLKRRRALAFLDRNYIESYAKAAKEAAENFVYSAPIAAVAAEAVVLGGDPKGDAQFKTYAERLTQSRFDMLRLSLYILSGELESPASAAALLDFPDLLSLNLAGLPELTQNALYTDEFLLMAMKGDSGAQFRLSTLLNTPSPEITRMGAEFFYDHGNPLRAAELFSRAGGERDFARAADAFALAGEIPGARNIWLALSSPDGEEIPLLDRMRFYYNLSSASADRLEEMSWLEKLFTQDLSSREYPENLSVYSAIRYSRLLETERSIAVLDDMKGNPLTDLELLRRRQPDWPPTRAAAEVWILLGRHSEDEDLYEWAAWYFERQRLYSEIERLIKEATRKGMGGTWLDLHRSFALIRAGKTADAEKILLEASANGAGNRGWMFYANLGRIQESRRIIPSALEYYTNALSIISPRDRPQAAQLQMRISRCHEALGNGAESRRALEAAYELDPQNINIRQMLRRL